MKLLRAAADGVQLSTHAAVKERSLLRYKRLRFLLSCVEIRIKMAEIVKKLKIQTGIVKR